MSAAVTLIDILLANGALNRTQVDQLKAEGAASGKEYEEILKQHQWITDEQLLAAKAQYYNIPFVRVNEIGVSPDALSTVPQAVAQRYRVLPFAVDRMKNTLLMAMANPLDLKAIDFIEKKTNLRVVPHFALAEDIELAIQERFGQSLNSEVSAALKETSGQEKVVLDGIKLGEVIREAPIAKIVETLLTFAVKARASDIHIEPQEEKTRVRYRIDGILHERLVLPRSVQEAVISRIKILADLKIDEKRIPQDGRFSFALGGEEVDLRVSTLPTVHGEKVVMRLLKKGQQAYTLTDLGLRGLGLKNLEQAVVVPHGIILITGPTGSGKTTTLYAILSKINSPKVNIVTLEDPVEYEIPGVNQVQINPKAGLTFASGLRSFLRQDPNIIMVGEVRDTETADLAIQASLTGHLVFSTLHTNSASGALPRLLDMQAEPFLLASSMTCVVAQRVVRQICQHCKTDYQPEAAVLTDLKKVLGSLFQAFLVRAKISESELTLAKGKGCAECNDTGYSGRIGIFEVLPVSQKIGRLILERQPSSALEMQAISEGMLLMKQDGYLKILEKVTTVEEVLRVAEV
ncbi:hypothetical protein A2W24_04615 [Microgenomates group bacterium RBG_16_45_19]|nr:MAG: hypothetical protein A2W24_04615 [Microgenomates group bacterium RBG_16_45_19]